MQRFLVCLIASLFLVFFLPGCREAPAETDPFTLIKSYRDIPGITEEEISAIEALKASGNGLVYGTLLGTEAFLMNDGTHAGFAVAYCKLLTDLFGINFTHQIYEWDDLITSLENHTLDFTGELKQTEDRLLKFSMTHPVAERFLRIFRHEDSDIIYTEMDISGLKIGFLEGSMTADIIRKTYPFLPFFSFEVSDYQTAVRMILSGEIDAFIGEAVADPVFDEYDFIYSAIAFPMIHEPVSMTTANPDLAPIISVVDKYITSGGIDRLYDMYKEGDFQYAKHKLQRSLSNEEKAYITDLQMRGAAVPVAYSTDNYPVNFYNANEKQIQGIAPDVLAEVGKLLDIEFTEAYEKGAVWADLFEDVKAGKFPMFAELLQSEERQNHFLWTQVPYSRANYAFVSKADFPNLASYQIVRYKVGVLRHSAHEELYRELFPNNNNLTEYDTFDKCLLALERGDVDLLMASEHVLIMQTHYHEKPGFKINLRLKESMDSYFGFNINETILRSIIDKAQAFVQTDMIDTDWTGRAFDYSKKLAEQRAVFLTGFVSLLSLLLLATFVLLARIVRLSKKLKDIASHDMLTGILNRRYFMEMGLTQIDRSARLKKECFISIFDLDHFKLVNDTHGHQAGDKVLKDIAGRVKKSVRIYDLFGRYGGEEFVILMFDTDKKSALNALERIREDICKTPIEFEGIQIPISASFGAAYVFPKNDMDGAIKCADDALYQAKETGRNKVVFYGDGN